MSELKPGQPITREIVERWTESMAHLSPNTRINRLCVLRKFCQYLSYFDPRTCLIHRSCSLRRTRPAPYIYTGKELRRIMAAASRLGPPGSFRPVTVSNLIGLLYTTGLRVGEALSLTLGDVDLKQRVVEVRQGKFSKSRYVPLSPSATTQLARYLLLRLKAGFSTASTAPVFPGRQGGRYWESTFATAFLQVLRSIGLRGPKGQRGPRIHDLRHSFAVNRLLAWYRQRASLAAKLPLLSTYMGHSTISGTEVYLHATAQLLEQAGQRFHAHFAIPPPHRPKRHDKD
jgi:integrase